MKQMVLELLFCLLALGNTAIHNHQLRDLTFGVADRARYRLQDSPTAVLVPDPVLQPFSDASFPRFSCCLQHLEAIVGMDLLERGSLAQLRRRVTQNSLVSRTVVQPSSLHVHQSNHVGCIFGDNLKEFLVLLGLPVDQVNSKLLVDHQNGQRGRNPEPLQQHVQVSWEIYRPECCGS